jgi:hypothetical protein
LSAPCCTLTLMTRTNIRVPTSGHDRRDVQVLLDDGIWTQGEEKMTWDENGVAWSQVQWRRGPGQGTYVGQFPADRVRDDETDYRPEHMRTVGGALQSPDHER